MKGHITTPINRAFLGLEVALLQGLPKSEEGDMVPTYVKDNFCPKNTYIHSINLPIV